MALRVDNRERDLVLQDREEVKPRGPVAALRAKLDRAKAALLEARKVQPAVLHCRDCSNKGRDAACDVFEAALKE
jgi:hypothetical protein